MPNQRANERHRSALLSRNEFSKQGRLTCGRISKWITFFVSTRMISGWQTSWKSPRKSPRKSPCRSPWRSSCRSPRWIQLPSCWKQVNSFFCFLKITINLDGSFTKISNRWKQFWRHLYCDDDLLENTGKSLWWPTPAKIMVKLPKNCPALPAALRVTSILELGEN